MKRIHVRRWAAAGRLLLAATAVPLLAAATGPTLPAEGSAAAWKINTHLFAANVLNAGRRGTHVGHDEHCGG